VIWPCACCQGFTPCVFAAGGAALQVISAMVDSDYMSLVKTRPVGQWRETLAVLATYTGQRHGWGLVMQG